MRSGHGFGPSCAADRSAFSGRRACYLAIKRSNWDAQQSYRHNISFVMCTCRCISFVMCTCRCAERAWTPVRSLKERTLRVRDHPGRVWPWKAPTQPTAHPGLFIGFSLRLFCVCVCVCRMCERAREQTCTSAAWLETNRDYIHPSSARTC